MDVKTGQLYAPRYSGRKLTIYRIKHVAGKEIIMEFWDFDKKSRTLKLSDKYVPMDYDYFRAHSEREGIEAITGEFKEELALPAFPEK